RPGRARRRPHRQPPVAGPRCDLPGLLPGPAGGGDAPARRAAGGGAGRARGAGPHPAHPGGRPPHRRRLCGLHPRGVDAMTAVWVTIAGLTVTTVLIKAFGPLVFGGRDLPGLLARVIPLLAPALLAALVVTETIGGTGRSLVIDARGGGLAMAAFAILRRG